MCDNCPFSTDGKGKDLADSLRPGRLQVIKLGLRQGQYFLCHKTTTETGDGSNLVCVGALDYQKQRGIVSRYQKFCEQLEGVKESKKEVFRRLKKVAQPNKEKQ